MLRSREERFRSSVEQLDKRLGRAESFLDTQLGNPNMDRRKMVSRSSLPSEVYRDRNTLVEVTVHRNSRPSTVTNSKRDAKSWADSLSDTDIHFDKHTKSSLARAKPSPRKERKVEKPRKEVREKRSLQDLLAELREMLQVSGVKDVTDFVAEFDQKKTVSSNSSNLRQPQRDKAELEMQLERREAEASRYKEEYAVMVRQMEVIRESVNNLELQVVRRIARIHCYILFVCRLLTSRK